MPQSDEPVADVENSFQIYCEKTQIVTNEVGHSSSMMDDINGEIEDVWRCLKQDTDGVKEEEDTSIVIQKYKLDDIIKEESTYQESVSKTSTLIASLTQIVEKRKKEKWSEQGVTIETSSKESSLGTVEKLKVILKGYRNMKVHQLVAHSDFEQILTMAARYEELSSASVSYISRLSMYTSVIKEGTKASQRVQFSQQLATLLKEMAMEKQKRVDADLALVKDFAQRRDMLYAKIFEMKRLVLKFEAEKEEVDMNFQKIVGNLSHVLEEASTAYEEYKVVERKWKEEQASLEYLRETMEKAEIIWVQFLGNL